jgi:hypothetical protein
MSETTSDTYTRIHHRGSNPSRRPPMSETQRQKLSKAQKAYVTTDPRWAMHRQHHLEFHDVIRRELAERGYSTAPIRLERRAKRGTGFWHSFD